LSRKSNLFFSGRTDTNKVVILPFNEEIKQGNYVRVRINRATSGTLFGDIVGCEDLHSEKLALTG